MQQTSAVPQWPQQPAGVMMPMQTSPQRRIRNTYFKIGVGLLVLTVIIFIIGYSAPAWTKHVGLWMACSDECVSFIEYFSYLAPWFHAVRAIESLALVAYVAAVGVELYQDVIKSPTPRENRLVEIFTAVGSVFNLIGVIIYGAKQDAYETYYDSEYGTYKRRLALEWAFGLTVAASGLGFISAILIAYNRFRGAAATAQGKQAAGVQSPVTIPMQAVSAGANYYVNPSSYPSTYLHVGATSAPVSGQVPLYYIESDGRPTPVYTGPGSSFPAAAPAVVATPSPTAAIVSANHQHDDGLSPPAYKEVVNVYDVATNARV